MRNSLLYVVTLFFLLLFTGTFWGTWFPLTRSINEFSAAEFIHIGKVIISNVALAMRFIVIISLLLIVASLWAGRKKMGFVYGIVAFVSYVAVLLMTLLVLVPIDNSIKTWTAGSVPDNWEFLRDKWSLWHTLRSFTSIGGFILFSIFILTDNNSMRRKYKLEKKNKGLWK